MEKLFYLSAPTGEARPAVTLGQSLPKDRNGITVSYHWRQAIKDGTYKHPVKGFTLAVDHARRRTWEANYRRMREAGEDVPVVKDHADDKSDATLGYVVDVRQNGDWYEELHQYLGDAARDVALRNKISVGIDPDYSTGTGLKLGDCIVHSATTPRPVVGGQGEAVPIAASRGPAGDVLELAATSKEPEMNLSALRKAAGLADTIPDQDVIDQAAAKLGTLPAIETAKADAEAGKVTAETALATAKVELSRAAAGPKPIDPDVLADRADNKLEKIENLVAGGAISEHQAEFLRKRVKGADGKPIALMLSRTAGGDESPVDALLAFAGTCKSGVVADGQRKTGLQELARPSHDRSGVAGPNATDAAELDKLGAEVREHLNNGKAK